MPFLAIARFTFPNYPAGTILPGFGMDGGDGELLIRFSPPPLLTLAGAPWTGPGNPVPISLSIPANPNLAGLTVYLQGRIFDPTPGAAVRIGLTEAYALTVIP